MDPRRALRDPFAWIGLAGAVLCASAEAISADLSVACVRELYDAIADRLEAEGLTRDGAIEGQGQLAGWSIENWQEGWARKLALVATDDGQKTGCILGRGGNGRKLSPRPKSKGGN